MHEMAKRIVISYVVLQAKPWLDAHNIKELVDPSLGDNYNRAQVERVVLTASLCVEQSPLLRPRMVQASIQPNSFSSTCSYKLNLHIK